MAELCGDIVIFAMVRVRVRVNRPGWSRVPPKSFHFDATVIHDIGSRYTIMLDEEEQLNIGCGPSQPKIFWLVDNCKKRLYSLYDPQTISQALSTRPQETSEDHSAYLFELDRFPPSTLNASARYPIVSTDGLFTMRAVPRCTR